MAHQHLDTGKLFPGSDLGLATVSCVSTVCLRNAKTCPWHKHAELEILVCLKGSHRYEFKGRSPLELRAGGFIIVPPHLQHRIHGGVDDPGLRLSILLKSPKTGKSSHKGPSGREHREVFDNLLGKRLQLLRIPFFTERVLTRLFTLVNRGNALSRLETAELRALILFLIANITTSSRADLTHSDKGIITDAIDWLEQNLDSHIALDKLIEHIGYGRSRFFTLFKQHTGLTPLNWITQRRIERAKELLASSNASMSKIANAVGFSSSTFFSRTFRKLTGMPPHGWRMSNAPSHPRRT